MNELGMQRHERDDLTVAAAHACAERVDQRVRHLDEGEPLDGVLQLRREVYQGEQGYPLQNIRQLADGLDASGTILVAEDGDRAIATLRLHDFASPMVQVEYGQLLEYDRFAAAWHPRSVAVGSRLAVRSDRRNVEVVGALFDACYRNAQARGLRFVLVACLPSLLPLFEHYGFREYLPPAAGIRTEAVLRMVLVMEDAVHFRQCGSPLLSQVRQPAQGAASRDWLQRSFRHLDSD
ncbi:hypothetical protein CSC70_02570 [Pseudoxanthomonas kalamensis DSM 18571]|uniref:N-acyl amino acid synthase FeeM domain-containing protein n=1 Tax=Pseudoxanthomonas kalamensis TaxID=289483 RepID=UPI0013920A97|nr:hypothetical protein [Pseudoxanthomonas kalamensis]KAF1712423.1 hypothetical protein CSC70_02570 [Pseudoxanthomonas kalamensis DSM 18571]